MPVAVSVMVEPVTWHGRHEFKLGMDADRVAFHEFVSRHPIHILGENGSVLRETTFPAEAVASCSWALC